jgi:glutathione S-transferase
MKIKVHAFPLSPRAFKALVVANHVGVEFEFSFCDLTKGATRTPEFAAINPNQKMPVLEDGDFKLWESNAIIEYLAALKPEAGLIPADARARADVLRWMFWESTTWDSAAAILAFEQGVKPFLLGGTPDPVEVEKGLRLFTAAAAILNAHLEGREYVCGDRLSLADFSLAADLTLEPMIQLPLADYPNIRRWGARMAELPAWKQTLALRTAPAVAA